MGKREQGRRDHTVILTERKCHAREQGRRISREAARLAGMRAGKKILRSHFETAAIPEGSKNKKEVKTGSFSPPGVVGCCMTIPSAVQQACPARQVRSLTRALHLAIR